MDAMADACFERQRAPCLAIRAVCVAFALFAATNCGSDSDAAGATPVSLAVRFKLTDLDYKPLPESEVRLVFGSDADWQSPSVGHRFVTDGNGEHRFETTATLDKVARKTPTNFIGSLVSRPQITDRLMVGAELEYMTFRWLYRLDAYRFPDSGDIVRDGVSLFSKNAQGRFDEKAELTPGGWKIADLGGMMLTDPGYDAWNFMFEPDTGDATGKRWTLDLAFKRSPPPVRR